VCLLAILTLRFGPIINIFGKLFPIVQLKDDGCLGVVRAKCVRMRAKRERAKSRYRAATGPYWPPRTMRVARMHVNARV
jgi:hypothetical protein